MSTLKIYYSPMSSSTRCIWALEELGIPYEKIRVHLDKLEQKKPEYLLINPNGKIPALIDGNMKMFESIAILLYLGEKYGVEKGLWPKPNTEERLQALSWTIWSCAELQGAVISYLMHTSDRSFAFPKEHRHQPTVDQSKTLFDRLVAILDASLEGKEYVAGGGFTFADLAIAGTLAFATMVGGLTIESQRVNEWLARVQQRPALGRAISMQ